MCNISGNSNYILWECNTGLAGQLLIMSDIDIVLMRVRPVRMLVRHYWNDETTRSHNGVVTNSNF